MNAVQVLETCKQPNAGSEIQVILLENGDKVDVVYAHVDERASILRVFNTIAGLLEMMSSGVENDLFGTFEDSQTMIAALEKKEIKP